MSGALVDAIIARVIVKIEIKDAQGFYNSLLYFDPLSFSAYGMENQYPEIPLGTFACPALAAFAPS
jgi:hypothetical protein